jgi:tRNA threonylcarbamoyladenosine biosynthesis protein TsaE
MSSPIKFQIDTPDLASSLRFAEQIGGRLRGGELIELASDLGGGKTTFVRGIALGAGSLDHVSSPSFTLTNVYETSSLLIHHFDFYRLNDPGILRNEIAEVLTDTKAVVIIEWADSIKDMLPDARISMSIRVTGDESRHYEVRYSDAFEYLFNRLSI